MYKSAHALIAISLFILTACTNQTVKEQPAVAQPIKTEPRTALPASSPQDPPLTELKNGKTLNMVRVMDGAACKDEYQGVKGTFLVYAEPSDIERIKREKGSKIFADFEIKIQTLASDALQNAADATNFAEDPFALGVEEARQKLANQLSANFQQAIAIGLKHFHQETTLMIDIIPFAPSLIFYQKGCEATQIEPDEQQEPQK
jgi:hypothetical protein